MTTAMRALRVLGFAATCHASGTMLGAQPSTSPPFGVEVRDVRTIAQSSGRGVALTLRFINHATRPLNLVADHQSLTLTDDRGNRYDHSMHGFGIGFIASGTIDPKFTIAPGEFGDAFLSFEWTGAPGKFFGLEYALSMRVSEVEPVAGDRSRVTTTWPVRLAKLVDGASIPAAGAASLSADACAGRLDCTAAATGLIAELARVSSSISGNTPLARFGVRFRNTGGAPMVLCLTSHSERAADDQGNTYILTNEAAGVHGIGVCDSQRVDASFVIPAGGTREATLEYAYFGVRGAPRGTKGDFSFAVQQLELLPGEQVRSMREMPILFRDLPLMPGASTVAGNASSGAGATTGVPGSNSEHPPAGDPCASIANCYAAGPFTVQLTSVVVSKTINERYLRVAARFRNTTGERLILCFTSASGTANDERQNRYGIRESYGLVKGIGLCNGQTANPDFVLAPGGQRDASLEFNTGIYQGTILGDVFAISFALEQLNILPGNQIQRVGEYVASFEGVKATGGSPVLNAPSGNEVQKARGLFDQIKKAVKKP